MWSVPPSVAWIGSGGSVAGMSGRQINISLGDTCVAGIAASVVPDGGSVTFSYFSTIQLDTK